MTNVIFTALFLIIINYPYVK